MRSLVLVALSVLLLLAPHASAVRNAAAGLGFAAPEEKTREAKTFGSSTSSSELLDYNPVAKPDAIVKSKDGRARFTVLTDRLVRMEWNSESKFEDRASIAVVNRNLPKVTFSTGQDNKTTVIETSFFQLTYTENVGDSSSGFTEDNLVVKGVDKNSPKTSFQGSWKPGMLNEGALPGTVKSLDMFDPDPLNCTDLERRHVDPHHEDLHCAWAVFSRSGWKLFDDTTTPVLNNQDWWDLDQPNQNKNDWYLFTHGLDYLGALKDYRSVGGVIPLLRKATLGTWWTRWFNYNSDGIKHVVNQFRQYSLPLDVLVYDMNWHTKDGSPDGWTGYTWDTRVLPNHNTLNRWLKSQSLMTGANLHDDEGVGPNEAQYPALCAALGVDPADKKAIPFTVTNQTVMLAVEDTVLKPLRANGSGIDFWWIDWQQGGKEGGATGGRVNPDIWLNKVRSTDLKRQGSKERALLLSRWGGMGNHRYQIGFSGDIGSQHGRDLTWANLAYQPFFSMSGSNVGYGFWSHDILGSGVDDSELSLRWLQWGAMSGIMRIHDRGQSSGGCNDPFAHPGQIADCAIDLPWKQSWHYFQAMRDILQLRAALLPYLYNAAREAFDTGVSLIRPMYYYWPENDSAYLNNMKGDYTQYMLGPDLLVAPVVSPVDKKTNMAWTTIWLPNGCWIERSTGAEIIAAGENLAFSHFWDVTEVPTYLKEGSIIPISLDQTPGDTIGKSQGPYQKLGFEIYPFMTMKTTQEVDVYEDDGATTAYIEGDVVTTHVVVTEKSDVAVQINLTPPAKPKSWLPETRSYVFKLNNYMPAVSVSLNGETLSYDDLKRTSAASFYYDFSDAALVISTGPMPIDKGVEIAIQWLHPRPMLSGVKGVLRRSNLALNTLNAVQGTPGFTGATQGSFERLTSLAASMEDEIAAGNLEKIYQTIDSFDGLYKAALQEIEDNKQNDSNRKAYVVELMKTAKLT